MDKTTQGLAWSLLPKEFKDEVRETYKEYAEKIVNKTEPGYRIVGYIAAQTELELLFGRHNLTSDAEGEVELLHVTRQKVLGLYANAKKLHDLYTSATCINEAESRTIDRTDGTMSVLKTLFGSKCLPDNVDSLDSNVDSLDSNVDSLEPKRAEPNPDGDKLSPEPQPANRTPSSYTQPVTDCHHTDRLHIAAMAMLGILSNTDRLRKNVVIGSGVSFESFVARDALRYADALIAESHK